MTEVVRDEFFRRYRLYVRWTVRRICASILDTERLEHLTEAVLIRMDRKAQDFSPSDIDKKKLSRRVCVWLDETLCRLLRDELSDKDLFDLMARRRVSRAAELAARKAHDEIYRRYIQALRRACQYHGRKYCLSESETEDVAQEVMWHIYEIAGQSGQFKVYQDNVRNPDKLPSQVRGWLSTIALNKIRDRIGCTVKFVSEGDVASEVAKKAAPALAVEEDETLQARMKATKMKLVRMIAVRALSSRDYDVFETEIRRCLDEKERTLERRKVQQRRGITRDHRAHIFERCFRKIKICLGKIADIVLSGRNREVFMAMIMPFADDQEEKETWKKLAKKYHVTREVAQTICDLGCKKIMRYLRLTEKEGSQVPTPGKISIPSNED